jgi:hypothetical protein
VVNSISTKLRYQSFFFVGIALVIVLLPFPNIFGIMLDAAILALAYPIIGSRFALILVYIYNFNPLKLNGAITLYYVLYGVASKVSVPQFLDKALIVGSMIIMFMLFVTFLEYLVIKLASVRLWRFLSSYDSRMKDLIMN